MMLMKYLLFSCSLLVVANCYKFLVISPIFAHSHAVFLGKVADALTDAGHNVTMFYQIVNENLRNQSYTRSTKNIVIVEPDEGLKRLQSNTNSIWASYWVEDTTLWQMYSTYKYFYHYNPTFRTNLMNNLHVLDQLKKEKFDVIICEQMAYVTLAMQEYMDIPTIIPVTSITHDARLIQITGESASPVHLSGMLTNLPNDMTFTERLYNAFVYCFERVMLPLPQLESILHPGTFHHFEDFHKAPFVFYNSNPHVDFPRPLSTKSVLVGGITLCTKELRSKKVPEEYNNILNERTHTMLVSFGSMFLSKDMPESYKKNIAKVMESFPDVTFIWKYETDDLDFAKGIKNIYFRKWTPQTALLADSRLTAFFTHAGLGSVNELSYLGKPAILCPIFGDQKRNAKMLSRHNGSIEISKYDLSDFNLVRKAFDSILNDPSYQANADKLAKILEKQPIKPNELLVKYAEFAAEFGEQPALDPHYRTFSLIQYFLIDVILTYLLAAVLAISIIFVIIKNFLKLVCTMRKTKEE